MGQVLGHGPHRLFSPAATTVPATTATTIKAARRRSGREFDKVGTGEHRDGAMFGKNGFKLVVLGDVIG